MVLAISQAALVYAFDIDNGKVTINDYIGNEVNVRCTSIEVPHALMGRKREIYPVIAIGKTDSRFPWHAVNQIIIPEGVKYILPYAFEYMDGLISVELPDSLESIGEGAFKDCSRLKKLVIPETIKSIGTNAFHDSIEIEYR